SLLLIFAISLVGLAISIFSGSIIPFWILLGFSFFYSVEKWLIYYVRRHRHIGRLYRLLLNLSILAFLGLLIWSGTKLFSREFVLNPLIGSLVFIAEIIYFIWMWRLVSKNSWRWPSMKLTIFCLIVLFIIFAFAGVSPFSTYKDNFLGSFNDINLQIPESTTYTDKPRTIPTTIVPKTSIVTAVSSPSVSATPLITISGINSRTGEYRDYYLGLVKSPEGVIYGSECYGLFIVLINNKQAKNPTYSELLNFLKSDKTDEFLYYYTLSVSSMYYGEAEDKINLERIQGIIDGNIRPDNPNVCADFAERLHNNAELAGIRCGYVSLDMTGYTDPNNLGIASNSGHACNVFQTTDKGIVYIDCTGNIDRDGPSNNDTIVNVQIGNQYNPDFLFPSGGWYVESGVMGVVEDIFIAWDGDWR
ncbi:hypothetical protein ACFLV2_02925, partial [Chloroflexota bacterium]